MRVVSLLPSATELLCAIEGGADLLVGRSHECDWPRTIIDRPVLTGQKTTATTSAEIDAQVRAALRPQASAQVARASRPCRQETSSAAERTGETPVPPGAGEAVAGPGPVSSLYTLDTDLLRDLRPDVILTQDLCSVCSIDLGTVRAVAAALDPPPRILSLNPANLEDVFDDLLRVGYAVDCGDAAARALVDLRERFWSAVDYVNPYLDGPEVAFLEWMDPLFVGGHWTPQLIRQAGGRHSLNEPGAKSRQVPPEELVVSMPDRLIICPCGFGLEQIQHDLPALTGERWWRTLPAVQDGHVVLVDGSQMFNRPGPRLVDAFRWLVAWLNDRPEVAPRGFPVRTLSEATARGRAPAG